MGPTSTRDRSPRHTHLIPPHPPLLISIIRYFTAQCFLDELRGLPCDATVGQCSQLQFNRMSVVESPVVIRFMVDAVQLSMADRRKLGKSHGPVLEDSLWRIVDASADASAGASCRVAAANAITVLNMARVAIGKHDLSGVNIPGADLSYALFVGTSFRNANLTDANFSKSYLTNVDFTGANLTNVVLGEMPRVQLPFTPIATAWVGERLLYSTADGSVRQHIVCDRDACLDSHHNDADQQVVFKLPRPNTHVREMVLSPVASKLWVGGEDALLEVWSLAPEAELKTAFKFPGHVASMTVYTDSSGMDWLLAGSHTGHVFGYTSDSPNPRIAVKAHSAMVTGLAVVDSGTAIETGALSLVTAGLDGHICTFDLVGPKPAPRRASGASLGSSKRRPENTRLGSLKARRAARTSGKRAHGIMSRSQAVLADGQQPAKLAAHKTSALIVVGMVDGGLEVWQVEPTLVRLRKMLFRHLDMPTSLAVVSDRNWLVSASLDKSVKVADIETGRLMDSFDSPQAMCSALVDEQRNIIVGVSLDGEVSRHELGSRGDSLALVAEHWNEREIVNTAFMGFGEHTSAHIATIDSHGRISHFDLDGRYCCHVEERPYTHVAVGATCTFYTTNEAPAKVFVNCNARGAHLGCIDIDVSSLNPGPAHDPSTPTADTLAACMDGAEILQLYVARGGETVWTLSSNRLLQIWAPPEVARREGPCECHSRSGNWRLVRTYRIPQTISADLAKLTHFVVDTPTLNELEEDHSVVGASGYQVAMIFVTEDGKMQLFDARTGMLCSFFDAGADPEERTTTLDLAADETYLVIGTSLGNVKLMGKTFQKPFVKYPRPASHSCISPVSSLAFCRWSPTSTSGFGKANGMLAVGWQDGNMHIMSCPSGVVLHQFRPLADPVSALALQPVFESTESTRRKGQGPDECKVLHLVVASSKNLSHFELSMGSPAGPSTHMSRTETRTTATATGANASCTVSLLWRHFGELQADGVDLSRAKHFSMLHKQLLQSSEQDGGTGAGARSKTRAEAPGALPHDFGNPIVEAMLLNMPLDRKLLADKTLLSKPDNVYKRTPAIWFVWQGGVN